MAHMLLWPQADLRVLVAMYLLNACGWFAIYKGLGMATPCALLRAAEFLIVTAALEGVLELGLRAAHRARIAAAPTATLSITMTPTTSTGMLQPMLAMCVCGRGQSCFLEKTLASD